MKKFIAMFLGALLLLCACALAEEGATTVNELGMTIDFLAGVEESPYTQNMFYYGTVHRDPYLAAVGFNYYAMAVEEFADVQRRIDTMSEEEWAEYSRLGMEIGFVLVTDAEDVASALASVGGTLEEGDRATEFGTVGNYHYYLVEPPLDDYLADIEELAQAGGTPEAAAEKKAEIEADIKMLREIFLKNLQAAERFEPIDKYGEMVGRTLSFETTDLDGSAVSSADLFRDNKITMVNVWGTWCPNCLNEMAELAQMHERFQALGCGIVGLEFEKKPLEEVKDTALAIIRESGVTYPNVIRPETGLLAESITTYPTTLFVDSEGRVLCLPITGALVWEYEPTLEKLLAGEEVPVEAEAPAESGEYRVVVCDDEGPVKGVVVQLCDDTTCSFQKTKADGVATFVVDAPKAYEVHVMMVPEGYEACDQVFTTPDTYSELNIVIRKAA